MAQHVKTFNDLMETFITDADFMLIESLDPVKWKVDDNSYVHKNNVDGKRVHVIIDRHYHKNGQTQHSVRFEVNGDMSKKRPDPNVGKKVLMHVAHAIHSYTKDHVQKGDMITMTGYDKNPETKAAKDTAYSRFAERLAKTRGGVHKTRSSTFGTVHSVHL